MNVIGGVFPRLSLFFRPFSRVSINALPSAKFCTPFRDSSCRYTIAIWRQTVDDVSSSRAKDRPHQ